MNKVKWTFKIFFVGFFNFTSNPILKRKQIKLIKILRQMALKREGFFVSYLDYGFLWNFLPVDQTFAKWASFIKKAFINECSDTLSSCSLTMF